MRRLNPFKFIEHDSQHAKKDIRTHAAASGHARRRESGSVETSTASPGPGFFSRQRLSKWTKSEAKRRKPRGRSKLNPRPVEELNATAGALETALLVPHSRPACLGSQEWIDPALERYFSSQMPRFWAAMEFETQFGFRVDMWTNWLRYHAMLDPAHFCLAAYGALMTDLHRGEEDYRRAIWLKANTIRQINDALSDPSRMLSSLSILIVLFTATCEAWTGDREASRDYHVPALRRMIAMKGEAEFEREVPDFVVVKSRWLAQTVAEAFGIAPILSPVNERIGDFGKTMQSVGFRRLGDDGVEVFDARVEEQVSESRSDAS